MKKAQLAVPMLDLTAFFLAILFIIVFIIIMQPAEPGAGQEFKQAISAMEVKTEILNYLRLPLDDKGMTFADLAAMNTGGSLDSQLESEAQLFLDQFVSRYAKIELNYFRQGVFLRKSFGFDVEKIILAKDLKGVCGTAIAPLPTMSKEITAEIVLQRCY